MMTPEQRWRQRAFHVRACWLQLNYCRIRVQRVGGRLQNRRSRRTWCARRRTGGRSCGRAGRQQRTLRRRLPCTARSLWWTWKQSNRRRAKMVR